jgi:hypothetical protein
MIYHFVLLRVFVQPNCYMAAFFRMSCDVINVYCHHDKKRNLLKN